MLKWIIFLISWCVQWRLTRLANNLTSIKTKETVFSAFLLVCCSFCHISWLLLLYSISRFHTSPPCIVVPSKRAWRHRSSGGELVQQCSCSVSRSLSLSPSLSFSLSLSLVSLLADWEQFTGLCSCKHLICNTTQCESQHQPGSQNAVHVNAPPDEDGTHRRAASVKHNRLISILMQGGAPCS